MAIILEDLHERYIPKKEQQQTVTLQDGTERTVDGTKYHQLLIGGDQLTVARVRGAASLRITHDTAFERLTGVVPVIEDWHGRLTLVKVREYTPRVIVILI